MIRRSLRAVGLAAPGLSGWQAAAPVLAGAAAYLPPDPATPEPPYAPNLLPPNERRRATAAVRQAFRAAEDAMSAGADPRTLASVFASSDADMAVLHRICGALAEPARLLSPTDFHNSVHNAASGYWSIAVQCTQPTTTIAAFDASFTAGLLEAVALSADLATDVLLVAYDAVAPSPLLEKRTLGVPASVALVIGAPESDGLGHVELTLGDATSGDATPESTCAAAALEPLRRANPALRALPLLELVAARRAGRTALRGTGNQLVTLAYSP